MSPQPAAAPLRVFTGPRFFSPQAGDGDSMAVLGDRIVGFGPLETWRDAGAEVVRLDGALAIPGLNDAHMHPSIAARDATAHDVSPARVRTRAQLERIIAEAAATTPEGQWIRCTRYDPSGYPDGPGPTRRELDALAPAHPVLLLHTACHWGVVNSEALRRGGLHTARDVPDGGFVGLDERGELDGVLHEQAIFDYVDSAASRTGGTVVPQPGPEEIRRAMLGFLGMLSAHGTTSATDALCGPDQLRLFSDLRASGELPVRINALLAARFLDDYAGLGIVSGLGNEWVRIGGYKAFVDGAVAGRTCLVDEPFEDSTDRGLQVATVEELTELAGRARRANSRLAVHANGDAAIRELVTALERDVRLHGPAPVRHRIEHCSMPDEPTIERIAALDLITVPFGSYAHYHGTKILNWYGAARAERMFPHRSLRDAGVTVAGSSDFPCGPFEPLLGLLSCVTRAGSDGVEVGGSQKVSLAEAIEMYTRGSAEASGEENLKGSLLPGQLADFAVFDEDLERLEAAALGTATVRSTWVGSREVFNAAGGSGER
ncbi:amidohydrolase [Paeniglutamicibacter sp. R2-26]|uniref:amidohydrolase n=1 Tax=Paeniglutamicibacter sp. R2-26 TaxID=3144417 RepID=UPI003EE4E7C1